MGREGMQRIIEEAKTKLNWLYSHIIIIIIIISCVRFSFFPGTSPLEPVVNPTTQASSLSL
jgi:hypothetical protein